MATLSACSNQPNASIDQRGNEHQVSSPNGNAMPSPVTGTTASNATAGIRTAPVVPGRPGRVFIFAGFDKDCKPLPPPELAVSKAPAQGDVSFQPGQKTTIAASSSGACRGTSATGTGVYYTARQGSSGNDSFSVTARMPTGETMTRTFDVSIAK